MDLWHNGGIDGKLTDTGNFGMMIIMVKLGTGEVVLKFVNFKWIDE